MFNAHIEHMISGFLPTADIHRSPRTLSARWWVRGLPGENRYGDPRCAMCWPAQQRRARQYEL